MDHIAPLTTEIAPTDPDLTGTILDFTPVPLSRRRADGWTACNQRRFIQALSVMGSVAMAARAVGMGRVSAYRLREKDGAESFAAAWDKANDLGRSQQYDVAMQAALHGVTTVRIQRGGAVSITGGAEMRVLRSAFRAPPAPGEAAP